VTLAGTVPRTARLRAELRGARRRHREGRAGDLYLALMFVVVYGGLSYRAVAGLGRLLGHAEPVRWWLAGAVALALAGLGYRGARVFGPLVAGPAEQTWALSTPVDRGRWLLGPLLVRVVAGALGGAVLGIGFAALAGAHPFGWVAATGAGVGAALVALAGLLQTRHLRRIHPLEWVPAGAGFAGAAAVLVVHARDVALPVPAAMPVPVAIAALVLAAALTVAAARGLGRVDRAALASGAQIADATATATIFLDPTLLFGVLEARRWRALGRVRRRPFWPGWSRPTSPLAGWPAGCASCTPRRRCDARSAATTGTCTRCTSWCPRWAWRCGGWPPPVRYRRSRPRRCWSIRSPSCSPCTAAPPARPGPTTAARWTPRSG
jgi:hypothetical protein